MAVQTSLDLMPPVDLGTAGMLAAVAVVLLILARLCIGPPMTGARRWGLLGIRSLILAVLLVVLINPVRVDQLPGAVGQPKVVYLLDTSQSMALGTPTTRFQEVVRTIREVDRLLPVDSRPVLSSYRFGETFSAIESPLQESDGSAVVAGDRDTQLLAALRQLPGRFTSSPPRAVVLFSDGRARDPVGLEEMARRYARMNVPIHVVVLGNPVRGGDVAIVNMVAPALVRKHSRASARIWVRSYGYDAKRARLQLSALGDDGARRPLAQLPITLQSGIQSFNLSFQTDLQTMRIEAMVPPRSDEVSLDNNAVTAEVAVDRTKIRVLYLEGSTDPLVRRVVNGQRVTKGPYSCLADALSEDPDIECLALRALPGLYPLKSRSRLRQPSTTTSGAAFPDTAAALFAFDAIVLSDVDQRVLGDRELDWIQQWINRRGGGLCMAGGPRSFAAGGWADSRLAEMLPVILDTDGNDWDAATGLTVRPVLGKKNSSAPHPIWNIVSDLKQNDAILRSLPDFNAANRFFGVKPSATAVALSGPQASVSPMKPGRPVIVLGSYGKGRSMAMATCLTPRWAQDFAKNWGTGDNRYYAKFWRNVVYWLSENSVNGRRRLLTAADKMSYQPGETIKLHATAFDEAANPTTDCRVTVIIEPQPANAELDSDYAPVGWPSSSKGGQVPRTSGEEGPYIAWGEELEMIKRPDQGDYKIELPIADTSTGLSGTQALRIEISAYEDYALVDSTSLDVQILDDPFERQNPLPNHELLRRLASLSGGKELSDARSLASAIGNLPPKVGSPEVRKAPLWSRWWLLTSLLILLTVEWVWRRSVGLA